MCQSFSVRVLTFDWSESGLHRRGRTEVRGLRVDEDRPWWPGPNTWTFVVKIERTLISSDNVDVGKN